jgi:hypothetical protein
LLAPPHLPICYEEDPAETICTCTRRGVKEGAYLLSCVRMEAILPTAGCLCADPWQSLATDPT